MCVIM